MIFRLQGEPVYPSDYPAVGETITVAGTFDTYLEEGLSDCELSNAYPEHR